MNTPATKSDTNPDTNPEQQGHLELWLIRHGETNGNRAGSIHGQTDSELCELGISQAHKLARRLKHEPFDGVYSSDLQRARITAEIALPDADIQLDTRLREIHFGILEDKSWDTLSTEEKVMTRTRRYYLDDYRLPGGETNADVRSRIGSFVRDMPDGKYAVFCHGGVVRNTLLWVMHQTMPRFDDWWFSVDNTSITIVRRSPDKVRIKRVNDTAHLEKDW
jgi:broad specificity phosphatase PhoE